MEYADPLRQGDRPAQASIAKPLMDEITNGAGSLPDASSVCRLLGDKRRFSHSGWAKKGRRHEDASYPVLAALRLIDPCIG